MTTRGMLRIQIKRKDKPILNIYFETLEQVKLFYEFIKDLISGVKEKYETS